MARGSTQLKSTRPIEFALGVFHLSSFRLPYFATVVRFDEVADLIDLVTDDPKYAHQDWSLTELYQREVDHARVAEMSRGYLQADSTRPQFFNSITVVLRAKTADGEEEKPPPPPSGDFQHVINAGPIAAGFFNWRGPTESQPNPPGESVGQLWWNRDQVHAVAIDGQHRLAAIKRLPRGNDSVRRSSLSVLFLVFDDRLGFLAPEGQGDPLQAMRSIFIDLNKRSVRVSRARNVLLDDLSPQAACLRSVISDSLSIRLSEAPEGSALPWVGSKGEFRRRLPLDLIDWHGEAKSKIEQGPYLSSVLALDWIVQRLLDIGTPKKRKKHIESLPASADDVENPAEYYDEVLWRLQAWPQTFASHFAKRLQEAREIEAPFALSADEVKAVGAEFSEEWGRALTRLLTTIAPYRRLVELRMQEETVSPEFGQWYQAVAAENANRRGSPAVVREYREHREAIEGELRDRGVPIARFKDVVLRIEELKRESLFYFLVGQRALVKALIRIATHPEFLQVAIEVGLDPDQFGNDVRDMAAYYLVTGLNAFAGSRSPVFTRGWQVEAVASGGESSAIPNEFWAGALVSRDDTSLIDYSEKAAERGCGWMVLMCHLAWLTRGEQDSVGVGATEYAVEDLEGDMGTESPLGVAFEQSRENVLGGELTDSGAVGFLMRPFLSNKWNKTIANKLLRARLAGLLEHLSGR